MMKNLSCAVALVCLVLSLHVTSSPAARTGPIVHEWGTFTTVVGRNGVPIRWRPLRVSDDLPHFVYKRTRNGKNEIPGTVRMETPVLYFYSPQRTSVSVEVGFPAGQITEWYPFATEHVSKSIAWKQVDVLPDVAEEFPSAPHPSHYYAARATDAAPLVVRGEKGELQREKLLFYRGVGTFALPLAVSLEGRDVVLAPVEGGPSRALVVECRNGTLGYRDVSLEGGARVERPEPVEGGVEALGQELEAMLVEEGLYPREARAMLETWADTWYADGLRVFFFVPRATTDAVLPLTIDPAPESLVRVLVGRVEVIRPEVEAEVAEAALGLEPIETRAESLRRLSSLGHFEEPILRYVGTRREHAAAGALLRKHRYEVFREY